MSRTRRSAKQAGTAFETLITNYLASALDDDRIERRAKHGANDKGDIGGVRTHLSEKVVIECKNTAKISLGTWAAEAEVERGNDAAAVGVVAHKRHGKGQARDQWVTMTLADFAVLLGGTRE